MLSRFEFRIGMTTYRARSQSKEVAARLAGFLHKLVQPGNDILRIPNLLIELGPLGVLPAITSEFFSRLLQLFPTRASNFHASLRGVL